MPVMQSITKSVATVFDAAMAGQMVHEAARLALDRPGGRGGAPSVTRGREVYEQVLHDPTMRDPRGFILPADQPDFLTATKLVNTLIKAGIVVHRATASFSVLSLKGPP